MWGGGGDGDLPAHVCVDVCTCHCNGTYLQVLGYMQEQLLLRVLVQ